MKKREHNPRPYRLDKPVGCDIDGCERPHHVNGLCVPHYQRRQKYGDPLAGPPMRKQRAPSDRAGQRSDYHVKHAAVREARGPAWQNACEHCVQQAHTWAQIHDTEGDQPEHYMALCWSCHAKYDDFAARLPDNTGSKRTPEQRERMRQAALRREARKRSSAVLSAEQAEGAREG